MKNKKLQKIKLKKYLENLKKRLKLCYFLFLKKNTSENTSLIKFSTIYNNYKNALNNIMNNK